MVPVCWSLEKLLMYRPRRTEGKGRKFQYLDFQVEEKIMKIKAILYNWKRANRMEAGFSLNNRAKRVDIRLDDTTLAAITVSQTYAS